jgi:hypothetical protein
MSFVIGLAARPAVWCVIAASVVLAGCGGGASTETNNADVVANRAPVVSGSPAVSVVAGTAYAFTPTASDPDGNVLTYSIANPPTWASFSSSTGQLSGTPATANVGTTSNIVITVSDGLLSATLAAFNVEVTAPPTTPPPTTPPNQPPTISGTPATTVVAGAAYAFTPSAADADGDGLTFSMSGAPAWLAISKTTGKVTGTPTASNIGTTANIVISVSDTKASVSLPAFKIIVSAASTGGGGTTPPPTTPPPTTPTNRAPTIKGSPATSVTVGNTYSFTPTAADADGNTLTFAINNKPSWATFSTTTGALTGKPVDANVGTTSNIVISVSDGTVSTSLGSFALTVNAAPVAIINGAPRVLYLDQIAGSVTGGEDNNGTYVSIFGSNFGSDLSKIHVYFGSAEVAAYKAIGFSKGRTDIQQIVVQPGAAVGTGTLPVKVVVNGVTSNTNITFMVNPGDIYYVSLTGNDSTGVKNDPTKPYRHLQLASDEQSAVVGQMKPGDVAVLRGGTWTDSAVDNAFVRFWRVGGNAPTGTRGTGYMTVTGYPGETVTINAPKGGGVQGGGEAAQQAKYLVFSNLTIVGNPAAASDGATMNSQVHGDFWRVVNNDISWPGVSGEMLAGGVVGRFTSGKILGNHIHHIDGGYMNHGVYLDTATTQAELAYNEINNVSEGNLVQTYDSADGDPIVGLEIHHNSIHDGGRYGLNISEGTRGVHAWNNLIYNITYPGIRLSINESSGVSMVFEHNTLYNVCSNHPSEPGAVYNDYNASTGTVMFQFNVFIKGSGGCSAGYENSSSDSAVKFSRNLFYGYSAPSRDASALTGNPLLKALSAVLDFALSLGSPAIDAATGSTVTDDYTLRARSMPDLGAYEYLP